MSLPDPCLETSAISSFKGKGILEGRPIREICKKEKVGEGELKVGGGRGGGLRNSGSRRLEIESGVWDCSRQECSGLGGMHLGNRAIPSTAFRREKECR